MSDIAIRVENLSKRYRIGLKEEIHDTLLGAITEFVKSPVRNLRRLRNLSRFSMEENLNDVIWAIRDISFEIQRGEVIGIIGANGAGKTTLLKILSSITEPTKGRAEVRGRVSSLLEVGTGFHPELTGRENIYLNGTILGMRKTEVDHKFDEIVDFSGVEKFIDTPVKRYSSGMRVRLAFSVAAHLEPDILLVDEVLAVGDVAFQRKCLGKMDDVVKTGRTVLFVSHNMAAIRQLCPTCLWIDNGEIRQSGTTQGVIENYLNNQDSSGEKAESTFEEDLEKDFQLRSIRLISEEGTPAQSFNCDKPIIIEFFCQVRRQVLGLYGYLSIRRKDGTVVIESDSFDTAPNPLDALSVGIHQMHVTIPARTLGHGDYEVYISFASKFSLKNFILDDPGNVSAFHLDDFMSKRGNQRRGFFSTLLSWEECGV